jgi:uncharacterized protein YecE (DUF72 family)
MARMFGCVEVNSSFYAFPRAEHCGRWAELVRSFPDFRFLAKLHRDLTHGPDQDSSVRDAAIGRFRSGVEPLVRAGRLAALLAQFPVSFRAGRETAARVEQLAGAFGDLAPLAVELRHASWFTPRALAWLTRLGLSVLHVDLPAAPDHLPADFAPTSRLGYYRLHGRNARAWFTPGAGRDARYDHLYTPEEISEVVARARRLAAEHDELFVVTNNHFEGKAVVAGLEIAAGLDLPPVEVPASLLERYPRLAGLVRPGGQGQLY